ncbi:MAG: cytochrome c [Bryobacterales bacterium]|nr:cytochrome c [Bryobacterales bacterium]
MRRLGSMTALAGLLALSAALPLRAGGATIGGPVTFNGQVAEIVHQRCASCHRPGQAAPFSLLTYEDVSKRAALIRAVTGSRYMPPWHAEPGYGKFKGERRLPDHEVELLAAWVAAGAPEGSGPAPPLPSFPEGWNLGEPDLEIAMEEPYTVPADGPDVYRNFPARVPTQEDRWVRAIEFKPLARTVVHHSLFAADTTGKAREYDAEDDIPGYPGMSGGIEGKISLRGWAVGGGPRIFPEEAPIRLPAGSDFIFESHFHPSGKPETEVSTVALYFSEEPATKEQVTFQLPPAFGSGAGLDIAPGDADYTISESLTLPAAIALHSVTPHAHYIGKEFKAWAELPDGGEVPLIWIKDWDFAWQDMYVYEERVILPAGTIVRTRIRYDNSAENPRNPSHPPKRVYWGTGSEDEMGSIVFHGLAVDEAELPVIRAEISKLNKRHREQAKAYRERIKEEKKLASR